MAIMWAKLLFLVVFMLSSLAIVVVYVFNVSFSEFWPQMTLFFIAIAVGLIGVALAFRTKLVVIR